MITPKEITIDSDFSEYTITGLKYVKENNLKQTTNIHDILDYKHYIVLCGDIMVKVDPNNYPEVPKRIL